MIRHITIVALLRATALGTAFSGVAASPALAQGCYTPPGHWQRFGDLYVGIRNERGQEVGDRFDYGVEVAVVRAGPAGQVTKINPQNFTVRLQAPSGYGHTAFAWHNGLDNEPWAPTFSVDCRITYAPFVMFRGLDKAMAHTAILLIDGKQTLIWDIRDKIQPAPQRPSQQPPSSPPGGQPPQTDPNQPPVVTPPVTPPIVTPPVTPPAQTPPVMPATFKPLNRVDVRLDRVVVARGYPTHQVHAFVTVKNSSPGLQYFTSGFLKALLTDADGVSLERSQPYRASGEPAELFAATPVIQPGAELKVRYVFTPPEDARLTSLTLSEGGKRAEFPVGGL